MNCIGFKGFNFGALCKAVFLDKNLSLLIKRNNACVIPVYGAECWTPLIKHYRKLNTFHHRGSYYDYL